MLLKHSMIGHNGYGTGLVLSRYLFAGRIVAGMELDSAVALGFVGMAVLSAPSFTLGAFASGIGFNGTAVSASRGPPPVL